MNIIPEITAGQIFVVAVPIIGVAFTAIGGIVMAHIIKKAKIAIMKDVITRLNTAKEKNTDSIKDTNERVTTLAEGFSVLRTEHHEFRVYADKHFVEVGDLAEVKQGFQGAMADLRNDIHNATATMMDVRDSVIVLTTKDGLTPVKPQRRRPAIKAG